MNFLTGGTIPSDVCKFLYLYVIQISSALSLAHRNDLIHGKFDLSQVLKTNDPYEEFLPCFKIISFRPWLVQKVQKDKYINEVMTDEDMLQILKCKDLFDFGASIFDFMIGKTDEN